MSERRAESSVSRWTAREVENPEEASVVAKDHDLLDEHVFFFAVCVFAEPLLQGAADATTP